MSIRNRLASFIGRTPPDRGPEYDQHTWDNPSTSWRSRLTPSTSRGWAMVISTVVLGLGLSVYFLRFLPLREIALPTVAVALLPWVAISARRKLRDTFGDLAWSILTDGKSISVRYGRLESAGETAALADEDVTETGYLFTPAVSMSLRGSLQFLQVRDVFPTRENLRNKMHRCGPSGEAPAKDYLSETWTATAETDTIGTVSVTLTDGLSKVPRAADIDRMATTPSIFPTALASDVKALLEELAETQLPAMQRRIETEERRAEELARPANERVHERFDDVNELMHAAGIVPDDRRGRHRNGNGRSESDVAPQRIQAGGSRRGRDHSSNGHSADGADQEAKDALDDIDEQVDEAVDDGGSN